MIEAIVAGGAKKPGANVEKIETREMIPEAKESFLRSVFGVGFVAEQAKGIAIDFVAVTLTEDLKFAFADHRSMVTTDKVVELLQDFEVVHYLAPFATECSRVILERFLSSNTD